MDDKCTILVNSSDNYSDTWQPFFQCFKNNWENCQYDIVLNTESKQYSVDGLNIRCINYTGRKKEYGGRLLHVLGEIHSDFILLLLDDFFIRKKVDVEHLKYLISQMQQYNDIAVFTFEKPKDNGYFDDGIFDDYFCRTQICDYKLTLQGALWRKSDLAKLIKKHENPWELEVNGSIRAFRAKKRFYVLKNQKNTPIDYGKRPGLTWGIVRGKWVKDDVVEVFEKNGIIVDYEKRGFLKEEDILYSKEKKTNIIGTIKSLGFFNGMDLLLWRFFRFIKSRIGLSYTSTYVGHRQKLKRRI